MESSKKKIIITYLTISMLRIPIQIIRNRVTVKNQHVSSFRDPSGFVFNDAGTFKRLVSPIYFKQYHELKNSGFYNKLFEAGLLIPHEEISESKIEIILKPEHILFITYPYEWSFNQYKEAALLTLKLQKYSLEHGFSLKDASAYNVTFHKGRAVFLDTLSFDFYRENAPWRAYKQFVSHFLGPLVLSHYHGSRQLMLMSNYLDGIPLKLISSMLPKKTKFSPFLYSNIHLPAKFEAKYSHDSKVQSKKGKLSKAGQIKIVDSLYAYIKDLKLNEISEWGDYYSKINYSDTAFSKKAELVNGWVKSLAPKTVMDLGGNDGTFVRRLACKIEQALVCDIDNNAVDFNYVQMKKQKESYMLPMVIDILNPSPAIGLNNEERASFIDRITNFGPDITLALAIIHHMTLSGNVPFELSVKFFSKFSKYLIIEFPLGGDSWVERLLDTKDEFRDHFDFYTLENFEKAYEKHFKLLEKVQIPGSNRVMYLMKNKND